jgi:hypothetical protein
MSSDTTTDRNVAIHRTEHTGVSSVLEDGEVELTDASRVSYGFDFEDLSVCDGEAKNHEEAATWGDDDSDFAVAAAGFPGGLQGGMRERV